MTILERNAFLDAVDRAKEYNMVHEFMTCYMRNKKDAGYDVCDATNLALCELDLQ